MRYMSLARHLRPYKMVGRRRTTVNHMFAAAIAPNDPYEAGRVRAAVALLGNDPESDLECAYCGENAETWDHIFATVKNGQFSGHGHRVGNLVPCCKPCNSRKGNKTWEAHLASLPLAKAEFRRRHARIEEYVAMYSCNDHVQFQTEDHRRLDEIRSLILELMAEADAIADTMRKHLSHRDLRVRDIDNQQHNDTST